MARLERFGEIAPNNLASNNEQAHEQPSGSTTHKNGRQKDWQASDDRLFDRDRGGDVWLDMGVRLGRSHVCKVAACLVQIAGELNRFRRCAADHNPKSEVYFKRDPHRAPPLFLYFEDSKQLTLRKKPKMSA